jgi:hypothetical protein
MKHDLRIDCINTALVLLENDIFEKMNYILKNSMLKKLKRASWKETIMKHS